MDHQFDESYPFVYIGHVCEKARQNVFSIITFGLEDEDNYET